MPLRHLIAGLCVLSLATSLQAQRSPDVYDYAAPADAVDTITQATDVAFKADPFERMTLPVNVVGAGPYRFLIDTGSERSAISHDIAQRLRLRGVGTARLHSLTGASRVGIAEVPELDMRARNVFNLEAALLDRGDMGADGIVGLDLLRAQRVLFDFKAQKLTVHPFNDEVIDEEGTIIVTARKRKGRLIVSHARAEKTSVAVVVDTGAQVTIGNMALRRQLAREGVLIPAGTTELVSVTGERISGEYMYIKELEMGGVTLRDVAVVFADTPAFRTLGYGRKPAVLLGMNALRAFDKVSIDFARMKLRVVLPETSAIDGLQFASR